MTVPNPDPIESAAAEQLADAAPDPSESHDVAHRIRGALSALEIPVDIAADTSGAVLLFVHPQIGATVAVEVHPAPAGPTVTVLLLLMPWDEVADDTDAIAALLGLNGRLMSAAVALVSIADSDVIALARRVPAASLPPERVSELIEQMAWEYAALNQPHHD